MPGFHEHGSIPNAMAGSLSSKRTRVVVTIIPSVANSLFAETVQGVSEVLAEAGYQMLIGNTHYDGEEEGSLVRTLLSWRPAGLILAGVECSATIAAMISRASVPTVELWDYVGRPLDMVVSYSQYRIGWEMTRHLAERGYRRVALVCGVFTHSDGARARIRDREHGYRDAVRKFGLGEPLILRSDEGPLGMSAGARALAVVVERHPDVDAVFFLSDFPAAGALFECRRRDLPVPDGIAIAGWGDYEIASQVVPMLTTVRVPRLEIGRKAAEMLVQRLRGEEVGRAAVELDIEIVQRDST